MTRRLVLGFASHFILLILCSGLVIYTSLRTQLSLERSVLLKDRLDAIVTLLKSPAHGRDDLKERIEKEWPLRGGEKTFVAVLDAQSMIVAQSPGMSREMVSVLRQAKDGHQGHLVTVREADGPQDYLLGYRVSENSIGLDGPVLSAVAIGQQQGKEFLSTLSDVLAAVSLFGLLASALAGRWIIGRELRPLKMMAKQVAGIGSKNLHERIQLDQLPQEVADLAQSFNLTLDQLEEAFARLSRFSSDIAHELRTPIANVMGTFEVLLARPRTGDEYVDAMESALEECSRVKKITESLLFLARAEDQTRQLNRVSLVVRHELESIVDFLEASASERKLHLQLDLNIDAHAELRVEHTLFQRAIMNLVENAIRYTPAGGTILISGASQPEWIEIFIDDTGIGIPQESLPHITERFYRVDPSRNPGLGGAGLGLAIVKSIVLLHGGELEFESGPGRGTRVITRWPRSAS